MKKRYHNLNKLDSSQYALSMNCFIENYLGISGDFVTLTNKELIRKINSPLVISVNKDYVNRNFEEVLNGDILWIKDCNNQSAYYVNPDFLMEAVQYENLKLKLKKMNPIKTMRDLGPVLDIYQKLEKIEVIINILRSNHKYGALLLLKEYCDVETNLRQVGIFDQKRKVLSLSKI